MTDPTKEGWLYKRSRYLHQWRLRWVVLDDYKLYTFKNAKKDRDATEVIDLHKFSSIRAPGDVHGAYYFQVYSPDLRFLFMASDEKDQQEWLRQIGKAIVIRCNPTFFFGRYPQMLDDAYDEDEPDEYEYDEVP